MKAKRLLKAIASLETEMAGMDTPYRPHYRDEIRGILAEFLEDIFHHGGVYEIQQRVAAAQKIDIEAIQTILNIIGAANPPNFTLKFSSGTERDVNTENELQELNNALAVIRDNETTLGQTEILLRLELFFDSHIAELLMAFDINHDVFNNIKDVLKPKFVKIGKDELLLLWSRIKAQFKEDRLRSGFKQYAEIISDEYWNDEDIESIRSKVLDFIVRLKPMTVKKMISEGFTSYPAGLAGVARIAGATGAGLINSLDLLVIRSISHVVAFYEFITFNSASDLAKSIGQSATGLIFRGADFKDFLDDLKKLHPNNATKYMKLLYEKMIRLVEYVEEVAVTKTNISEALWHYKLGQEIIAPKRTGEIRNGKLHEIDLQKELSKFLIERGILSFGRTFGRNEIDLYSKEMSGEDFVVEAKIYKKSPSENQIVNNLVQLQSYMDQIAQAKGVLAIYNCSNDLIISSKKWHKGRFWILVINIGDATPSKRNRSIEIKESAETNKLIYCISSGEIKKAKSKSSKKKTKSKKSTKAKKSKK